MVKACVLSLAAIVPASFASAEPLLTVFSSAPGGSVTLASRDGSAAYFSEMTYFDRWSYRYTHWEWRRNTGEYRLMTSGLDRWLTIHTIASDGGFAVCSDNWTQGWRTWDSASGSFVPQTGLMPLRYTADELAFVASNEENGLSLVLNGTEIRCPMGDNIRLEFGDMTPDGTLVVGTASRPDGPTQAFAWVPGQSPVVIPSPEGPPRSYRAIKILQDGSLVIGRWETGDMPYYRWNAQTGFALLATLYTKSDSLQYPMFNDAGTMAVAAPPSINPRTMIWSAAHGLQSASDYLRARSVDRVQTLGIDLIVRGMSADGRTMWGRTPSSASTLRGGWIITDLPEPCIPDFNNDGFVDFFDYDSFVACFEGETCPPGRTADFTGDDFVDFFDYDAFVAVFESGC